MKSSVLAPSRDGVVWFCAIQYVLVTWPPAQLLQIPQPKPPLSVAVTSSIFEKVPVSANRLFDPSNTKATTRAKMNEARNGVEVQCTENPPCRLDRESPGRPRA